MNIQKDIHKSTSYKLDILQPKNKTSARIKHSKNFKARGKKNSNTTWNVCFLFYIYILYSTFFFFFLLWRRPGGDTDPGNCGGICHFLRAFKRPVRIPMNSCPCPNPGQEKVMTFQTKSGQTKSSPSASWVSRIQVTPLSPLPVQENRPQ